MFPCTSCRTFGDVSQDLPFIWCTYTERVIYLLSDVFFTPLHTVLAYICLRIYVLIVLMVVCCLILIILNKSSSLPQIHYYSWNEERINFFQGGTGFLQFSHEIWTIGLEHRQHELNPYAVRTTTCHQNGQSMLSIPHDSADQIRRLFTSSNMNTLPVYLEQNTSDRNINSVTASTSVCFIHRWSALSESLCVSGENCSKPAHPWKKVYPLFISRMHITSKMLCRTSPKDLCMPSYRTLPPFRYNNFDMFVFQYHMS